MYKIVLSKRHRTELLMIEIIPKVANEITLFIIIYLDNKHQ